jgi:hypothetical protein
VEAASADAALTRITDGYCRVGDPDIADLGLIDVVTFYSLIKKESVCDEK